MQIQGPLISSGQENMDYSIDNNQLESDVFQVPVIKGEVSTSIAESRSPGPTEFRVIDQFLENAGQILSVGAAANLTMVPMPELHAGGAALFASALLVSDMKFNRGRALGRLAEKMFGTVDKALTQIGLVACTVFSASTLGRIASSGHLQDPHDPRWLIEAANLAPFPLANMLSDPSFRQRIEQRFGAYLSLAYKEKGQYRNLEIERVPLLQNMGWVLGNAVIIAFGHAVHSQPTEVTGLAFMAGPLIAMGNALGSFSRAPGRFASMLLDKDARQRNVGVLSRQIHKNNGSERG
jgi:hypothetical protein